MNSQLSATSQNQIRNRSARPTGNSIRNYPQRNRPVSATAVPCPIALRQPTITSFGSLNNHLIDSTNLPIIYRLISIYYRSRRFAGAFAFCRRNLNHQLIINRFPVIINLARLVCLVTKWHPNLTIIDRRNPRIDRPGKAANCTGKENNVQSTCNLGPCNPVGMRARRCLISRFWEGFIARGWNLRAIPHAIGTMRHA